MCRHREINPREKELQREDTTRLVVNYESSTLGNVDLAVPKKKLAIDSINLVLPLRLE